MQRRALPTLAVAVALSFFASTTGCTDSSSDAAPAAGPGTSAPGDGACAEGFVPLPGGAGCTPVLPAAACPPGARAAIGSTTCAPVGVTACAAGFEKDASGWGCSPIMAAAPCAIGSGTRERLGSTTCTAVSDCNAPFPPAGATIFVDAAYADAQLDATHHRTLQSAVTAAPAGATIAVESGTYTGKAVLAHRAVKLIGRCAEKVIVEQTAGVLGSAIEAGRNDDFLIENFTFRGYNAALGILGGRAELDSLVLENGLLAGVVAGNLGTEVHLANVVIRGMKARAGSTEGFGIFTSAGANVTVTDSVFSQNEYVNVGASKAETTLTMSRSIVRDGIPLGPKRLFGVGVYVTESATVTVEESAIVDNSAAGFDVFSPADTRSTGTLRRSVVRGTKRDGAKKAARGIDVTGSDVVIEDSTIAANVEFELIAAGGAKVDISRTTLRGSPPTAALEHGATGLLVDSAAVKASSVAIVSARAGSEVQGEGSLALSDSVIQSTLTAQAYYEDGHYSGPGVVVESKASLVLAGSTIDGAHTAGVALNGKADITGSLVRGTRPSLDGLYGRGMAVHDRAVVTVARSAFMDNSESGVMVSIGGATLSMTSTTIAETSLDAQGRFGIGVIVGGDVAALLERCTVTGSKGIGMAVAAAGAFVQSSTFSHNPVGVHVQDGTSLAEGEAVGDSRTFVISKTTRFVENESRVGSGIVPLPQVLEPTP